MTMKKIKEWFNIQLVKNPGKMVIFSIFMFNVVFLLIAAVVVRGLSLTGTEQMGFFEAVFCTITMILDAGCIQFVVADIGAAGVAIVIVGLLIVLIGMISFTGAVIGYVTNYISNFIESANAGSRKLKISGHSVILNWNSRASEIINDLMYCDTRQRAVVLVGSRKKEIEKEIEERLEDTIQKENEKILEQCKGMGYLRKAIYMRKHGFKNTVTVVVREGDVFSSKQLMDISVDQARMIIILGNDINNTICKFEHKDLLNDMQKGNSHTVKILMQVANIASSPKSADNQKIIVEINDTWTAELVEKVIECKQVEGKCNIIPVNVNEILGYLFSQFCLMPELNMAYRELLSNKGAAFYSQEIEVESEKEYITSYLKNHRHSLPLTNMDYKGRPYFYYTTGCQNDINKVSEIKKTDYKVDLNRKYWIERKNVIILGHNSRIGDIMKGFVSFCQEWGYQDSDDKILRVVVIDDEKNLAKMNYYEEYDFVVERVAAEIYDREKICEAIDRFVSANEEDTSILILSDDSVLNEDLDANALANLIYIQDIVNEKVKANPDFDTESIDVIVEIIDPKHHDVVNNYSVNNVVISNRYISKMITQLGEKDALFDFYIDILTFDEGQGDGYDSKELYAKKVTRFFNEIPAPTTADQFVRAVYDASVDPTIPENEQCPTVVLGYVKPGGRMVLFSGDQQDIPVELEAGDKLIMFTNH